MSKAGEGKWCGPPILDVIPAKAGIQFVGRGPYLWYNLEATHCRKCSMKRVCSIIQYNDVIVGYGMGTNRRILIDNATLSGVERITGVSQTLNLSYIDNDILCLEKLITAILFSDKLIGIDDYKDKFRSNRIKRFNFVDFISINPDEYKESSTDSANFASSMTFSFDGSKPSGHVVSFFEALRIFPQLRWNVFVSSEYLTLSLLVNNQDDVLYGTAIESVFRNEITDSGFVDSGISHQPTFSVAGRPDIHDIKSLVHAFQSSNPNFAGGDEKNMLARMLFGFGWAAERSHFYNAVAQREGADVYLAPLRDAFCESCYRIDYPSQIPGLLESLKANSQQALAAILEPSGQAKFAIRLPFFTAYMISKTDNPKQCIDLALEMRGRSEFQNCRTIFNNLDHLSNSEKLQELNNIFKYLDQSCQKLMEDYSASTANGLQASLSLGFAGPSIGVSKKFSQLFRSHKNKHFSRIFRNMAQDMLNVERLGVLHEKICSSVRKHRDATHIRILTTPKYMENKDSEYGRPAKL